MNESRKYTLEQVKNIINPILRGDRYTSDNRKKFWELFDDATRQEPAASVPRCEHCERGITVCTLTDGTAAHVLTDYDKSSAGCVPCTAATQPASPTQVTQCKHCEHKIPIVTLPDGSLAHEFSDEGLAWCKLCTAAQPARPTQPAPAQETIPLAVPLLPCGCISDGKPCFKSCNTSSEIMGRFYRERAEQGKNQLRRLCTMASSLRSLRGRYDSQNTAFTKRPTEEWLVCTL